MTQHTQIDEVLSFTERVFTRTEGHDDLNTPGHQPNWSDRPSRFRGYPDLRSIPLAAPDTLIALHQAGTLSPADRVSLLLYLSLAPLRRRLDLSWNSTPALTTFPGQEFGRGAASGGGLYPTQCYLLENGSSTLRPGLYHYSDGTHALTPVRWGDCTAGLARALGDDKVHAQYLVLTADFWRNCFKYENFGYHVCTEDAGAAAAMLEVAAASLDVPVTVSIRFPDEPVNAVLGVDGRFESAFAVLALGNEVRPAEQQGPALKSLAAPLHFQRSRRVFLPKHLASVHRASVTPAPLPTDQKPATLQAPTSADLIPMPATDSVADRLRLSLPALLHRRRSGWSSMGGFRALPEGALQQVLEFVHGAQGSTFDPPLVPGSLKVYAKVSAADGLTPGAYEWMQQTSQLCHRPIHPVTNWQQTYSMDNYNVDESASVLFVAGDVSAALREFGPAGYRVLNLNVGRLAQRAYLAAAALNLSAGVVLGVRGKTVKRMLNLPDSENVFLAIYVGPAQPSVELFNFRLTH